ncbi:hypothetical protein I6N96_07645 [Enterococcus sp. BWM-S5]|uniref:Uncharacterized protein n=1 Tax=Enterococcus larvae TaxID=2794352 RepID=A0ABS4CI70_9ENTE|nr:hypothetical protein [Enterococcus larvae]MBP1046153.1 hypothetical protein [Enterococcus larvae]
MISRNIIKIISISIVCVIGLSLLIFIFKDQFPVFFPNQQKEMKVNILDSNIEAQIFIYVDEKHKNDFEVNLYSEAGEKISPSKIDTDRFTPKGEFFYSYRVQKGKEYVAKIANRTDSIIFSNVRVEDND